MNWIWPLSCGDKYGLYDGKKWCHLSL
jgi:hypothetical protein